MSQFFLILLNTALVNNLVLTHLLGLDLQIAASRRMHVAWFTGLATLLCLSLVSPLAWIINNTLLNSAQLQQFAVFIDMAVILLVVLLLQRLTLRLFPLLFDRIKAVTSLILVNSLLLGVILLQQISNTGFAGSVMFGIANGLGFLFMLLLISGLRERIDNKLVPMAFRGIPVLLVSLGIFSMALMGLVGIQ